MALNAAQRGQLARLPVADSSLGTADRYALTSVVQAISAAASGDLTEAQRRQLSGLGIANSSLNVGDRYAIARVVQSINSSGPLIEEFSLAWNIDPTFNEVVNQFAGTLESAISPFTSGIQGESIGFERSRKGRRTVVEWEGELFPFDDPDAADRFYAQKLSELDEELKELLRRERIKRSRRAAVRKLNFDILERSKK